MASWLDDIVGTLQSGYLPGARGSLFPDVPQPPPAQPDDAVALAATGEAGGLPFPLAPLSRRRVPDVNSAGIQLALDNAPPGTGVPGPLGEGPVGPAEQGMMASVGRGPGNILAGQPDGSIFGGIPDLSQFKMTTVGDGVPPSMALAKSETNQPPPGQVPLPAPRPPGADSPTDVSAQSRGQNYANILPPNAGPAPMSIAPPQAAPAERPLSDRIAGLGPGLLGIGAALQGDNSVAAAQMKQQQAQAMQLQQGNATARLLQSKGATPAEIQAAVAGGPEVMKALIGQYLGKDKFQVVQTGETENEYGAKQKVFKVFNANDGTFKDVPAASAAEAKAAVQSDATSTAGLTGADAMAKLQQADPKYARQVQAIIDGRESFPTGRQAMTPIGRKMIQDVFAVSGDSSEADFKNRQAVRKRYTSGKDFDITKSINTVVDHGKDLQKAIDDLHNYSMFPGFLNPVTGKVAEQFQPAYQAALGRFKQNADTFSRDYDFAVSGGRPTVSGRQAQRELFDEYGSPEKNNGALQKSMELLRDRLHEHTRGYEAGMLPHEPKGLVPSLNPEAANFIETMANGGRPAGAAPSSAAVKPGAYVWDPVKGLVPK